MSKQYDNNNSGLVYKNSKKEPGSKQPDRRGFCTVGGKEYWISGWVKETKFGPSIDLVFEAKEAKEKPKADTSFDPDDF